MNTTKIENLTFQQVAILANSGDIDASEFGHRAIRFLTLVAKGGVYHNNTDFNDLRNLGELLGADLATPAFVAHLNGVLDKCRLGCPLIEMPSEVIPVPTEVGVIYTHVDLD